MREFVEYTVTVNVCAAWQRIPWCTCAQAVPVIFARHRWRQGYHTKTGIYI